MVMRLFCQSIAVFKNLQLENSDPPTLFLVFYFWVIQSLMLPTKRKKKKKSVVIWSHYHLCHILKFMMFYVIDKLINYMNLNI